MKTLVLGATGATGKQVVDQLVSSGETVKAVVRPSSSPPSNWSTEDAIEIIRTQISELSVDEMAEMLQGRGYEPVWKDWDTEFIPAPGFSEREEEPACG